MPPVTDPGLPATPGVPCVAPGEPVLPLGGDVCSVPMEPGCEELGVVELGVVLVVPGCVVVVDGCDCVLEVPVCVPVPMPGLGVAVPVVCAVAMPTDNANTDDANRILRIEPCLLCTDAAEFASRKGLHSPSKCGLLV